MSKLVVAVIVAAACSVAIAQTPAPPQEMTPAEAANARQKASRGNVKSATSGTAKGYTGAAADDATKAAKTKDMPSVTPDNAAKQEALKSATAGTAKGYTGAAGDAATKAAGDKTPPPPKVKAKAGTPELNKVVP